MINVFSQCVRLGLVNTCLPSGASPCLCFFPPHKQHSDTILQDGIKIQYAILEKNTVDELQTETQERQSSETFPLEEKAIEICSILDHFVL